MSKKSKQKAKAAAKGQRPPVKESPSAEPSEDDVASDEGVMDAPTAQPTSEPVMDAPDATAEADEQCQAAQEEEEEETLGDYEAAQAEAAAAPATVATRVNISYAAAAANYDMKAALEEATKAVDEAEPDEPQAAVVEEEDEEAAVEAAVEEAEATEEALEEVAMAAADDVDADLELVEKHEVAPKGSPRAEAFSGLFYADGVDTHGKPVVVIDTDYLPPTKAQREAAADWLKEAMAPAVEAGEYSIVILGSRKTRASSWDSWRMAQQYKSLARPVRKNVQLLVWVNPTSVTKMAIGLMKPFVSKKGAKKIRIVSSLDKLAASTAGRLTSASLGSAYLETYST